MDILHALKQKISLLINYPNITWAQVCICLISWK